jgi:hypothetical protein
LVDELFAAQPGQQGGEGLSRAAEGSGFGTQCLLCPVGEFGQTQLSG